MNNRPPFQGMYPMYPQMPQNYQNQQMNLQQQQMMQQMMQPQYRQPYAQSFPNQMPQMKQVNRMPQVQQMPQQYLNQNQQMMYQQRVMQQPQVNQLNPNSITALPNSTKKEAAKPAKQKGTKTTKRQTKTVAKSTPQQPIPQASARQPPMQPFMQMQQAYPQMPMQINPALLQYFRFFNFPPNMPLEQRQAIVMQNLPLLLARQRASNLQATPQKSKSRNAISDFIAEEEEEPEPMLSDSEPSATMTDSEDDEVVDYDSIPDSSQNDTIATRYRAARQSKKPPPTKSESSDSDTPDFEEDNVNSVEHIYCMRQNGNEIEYLVRFNDSPPAMCQWIPEVLLVQLPNNENHLARFKETPFDFSDVSNNRSIVYPVSHRRGSSTAPYELLYRFEDESSPLYFWDTVTNDKYVEYSKTKTVVSQADPILPSGDLPEPTNSAIMNKDTQEELRGYQVDGLKWLIQSWRDGHGSILADEMGLGKTIQVLSFFTYLNKFTDWHGPFIVVVRTNTFKQWCEEIERWTDLKYCGYCGGPSQRKIIREYQFPALNEDGAPIPNTFSFNVLIVSYDVFLKDTEYLSKYNWEVFVVDEGHRIKNSQGKKNNAMMNLNAKHRILLTGTPIQNTFGELWTLLRFVSPNDFEVEPDWFDQDIDSIPRSAIDELQEMISSHLKRRTVQEVETTIAPKEECVAFISLSDAQRDLIRLTQLHKLYRIKPHRPGEPIEMDSAHEVNAILKICSHPFLIEGAEDFYGNLYKTDRLDLILRCSSKFVWLDNVLSTLKKQGDRVLIFSQRVKLLKLLQEYCNLRGHSNLILVGSMNENEKTDAIQTFARSDTFVFLISTRAGSEGLNLITANTAIIFDPDWNPQNDLQAQARCHRIGQTQKVNVMRLVTFRTFEHEMFIRAQNKLALWMILLGEKIESVNLGEEIPNPPPISIGNDSDTLQDCLEKNCTIVRDFTVAELDHLSEPLRKENDYSNGQSDTDFLSQFPLNPDDALLELQSNRVTKQRRYKEVLIPSQKAVDLYNSLQKYGLDHWEQLNSTVIGFAKRFSIVLIILSFRSIPIPSVLNFPLLLKWVISGEITLESLLSTNRSKWGRVFAEDSEYYLEYCSAKALKSTIIPNAMKFLLTLEYKLVRDQWLAISDGRPFVTVRLLPPHSADDSSKVSQLMNNEQFDPFDDRLIAIIDHMKSDIIISGRALQCSYFFKWWTSAEFNFIIWTLENFPFEGNPSFSSMTTIMSKTAAEIQSFASQMLTMALERVKGMIVIPNRMSFHDEAPEEIRLSKGFATWHTILVRDSDFLCSRVLLIKQMQAYLKETSNVQMQETPAWSEYQTRLFIGQLLTVGVDNYAHVLVEEMYGLRKYLSQNDVDFLLGKTPVRNFSSSVPEFCFDLELLNEYLLEKIMDPALKNESRTLRQNVIPLKTPAKRHILKVPEDEEFRSKHARSLDSFVVGGNDYSDEEIRFDDDESDDL